MRSADVMLHLINDIMAAVPADAACACIYQEDLRRMELIAHAYRGDATFNLASMEALVRQRVSRDRLLYEDFILLAEADLAGTNFQSGVVFQLTLEDRVIGLLVLFSQQRAAFNRQDFARFELTLSLIHAVIENRYLSDALARQLIVSEAILETTRMIGKDPSPQHIVDVLHEHLFDSHIIGCAILLYGPLSEDRPFGPFDYLEVMGSWAKRRGSGIALGTKLYFKNSPLILSELEEGAPLVFYDAQAELAPLLDPFARSLLRAARLASVTLLPLRSGDRNLGVILVGTGRPHEFSNQELQTYRAVSEFLAISAMSQVLQQQHDMVEKGRAALLDAVTDGVVMILPDHNSGRVLTANQRFTAIFGVPENIAQGLLLNDLLARMQLPEAVRRELSDVWLRFTPRDPATQQGEFHMVHSEGYPLDIEWYSAPVYQKDGHVLGRIYTFHDVTAERTAVRVRSAFLSRVSHELRTPLTSIHGFAEFILEVTGSQLPPLAREYTEIILSSAKHLRAIFTDMIEITRAEAGELRLNMQHTHLPDVVIDTVARLELQYKNRSQSVIMELDDNLPAVYIDPDRIVQVLTNLIMNAIKYSPESGKIRISACHITHPDQLPPGAPPDAPIPGALVSITDEGEGLSKEDVEQIFQPFFRTEWARINKIEGTGLGLAVARSIIELHRGRIWAEVTTPDHPGGRFLFMIPIVAAS